jgi:serine/threonine-protein kinase
VNAVPLSLHAPGALAAALRAGGVAAGDADVAAAGSTPFAVRFTGLEPSTLEALVRREGPLPGPRVAHIIRQVCASLEEAHDIGLVHRDIKPANIHLGRVGRMEDFVKVLDFGLVKPMGGRSGDSLETMAGMAIGTPGYMAPEMVQGEAIDGRADLYSVGCVAYFLLTGQLVFEGGTALQTLFLHLQKEPVPPSQRTEQSIPPELERAVLACLAKSPADRPASAGELSAALAGLAEAT